MITGRILSITRMNIYEGNRVVTAHDSGNWNYDTMKQLIEQFNDDVTFEELNNYVHFNKEITVNYG